MGTIDFDGDSSDFVTVPAGTYVCRVAEVRTGTTRAGDVRWSMRLVVADGKHVGRQAAWDSVVFSTRGRARARLVFAAVGLPAKGTVHVQPDDMVGRLALVEVRPVEYPTPDGGSVRRNEVPYDGWRPVPDRTPEPDPTALSALGRQVLAILSADDGTDGNDRLAAIVRAAVDLRLGEHPDDAGESSDPWLRVQGRRAEG